MGDVKRRRRRLAAVVLETHFQTLGETRFAHEHTSRMNLGGPRAGFDSPGGEAVV